MRRPAPLPLVAPEPLVPGMIAPPGLTKTVPTLPLPVSAPKTAPLRHAAEAVYEVGAQLAHFVDARG